MYVLIKSNQIDQSINQSNSIAVPIISVVDATDSHRHQKKNDGGGGGTETEIDTTNQQSAWNGPANGDPFLSPRDMPRLTNGGLALLCLIPEPSTNPALMLLPPQPAPPAAGILVAAPIPPTEKTSPLMPGKVDTYFAFDPAPAPDAEADPSRALAPAVAPVPVPCLPPSLLLPWPVAVVAVALANSPSRWAQKTLSCALSSTDRLSFSSKRWIRDATSTDALASSP